MITKKALKKARILAFWEKHGLKAAIDHSGKAKRTLQLWRSQLLKGNGKLESLSEKSTAPKTKRKRLWADQIKVEIKRLREIHPNLGKDKLYPELLAFCAANGLECPSITTIGRLIGDLGGLRTFPQKINHFGRIVKRKPKKVLRKPKHFKALYPGHMVAFDTVELVIFGKKYYIITCEDIYTRMAFAWATASHASLAAREFFAKVIKLFPFPIANILTDNGSEFKKHFSQALQELCLSHYHTYPKCPKMNSHLERFNRTIQEEFANYHTGALLFTDNFNRLLIDWLDWYNTRRVHYAFGNKLSPLQFAMSLKVQELTQMPQECKSGWTHTFSCIYCVIAIT
jgi:transposase InsO family protein